MLDYQVTAQEAWKESLQGACSLQIPDDHFQFLYQAAIHTMILHSPKEVYPGPFIYRRFWFRDAAFILYGLLCVGLKDRVRRAIGLFPRPSDSSKVIFSLRKENGILTARPCGSCASIVR